MKRRLQYFGSCRMVCIGDTLSITGQRKTLADIINTSLFYNGVEREKIFASERTVLNKKL